MANKYYIWKDPDCNGTNPDWIEISGTQFYTLGIDKTQKRFFRRIDDGAEDGADVLIMETTHEEYKDWHKKQESKRRKKKRQEQYKPQFISLDELVSDTEFTYSEVIPDISVNVEDTVFADIENSMLQAIIKTLTDDEKEVLMIVKKSIEENISERKICEKLGVDQSTFWSRKNKIFKKIKKVSVKLEKSVQCNGEGVNSPRMNFEN